MTHPVKKQQLIQQVGFRLRSGALSATRPAVSSPPITSRLRRPGPVPLALPALGLLLGLLAGTPVIGPGFASGSAAALLLAVGTRAVAGPLADAAVLSAWVALGTLRASYQEPAAWVPRDDAVLVRLCIIGPSGDRGTPVRLLDAWSGTPPTDGVRVRVGRAHLIGPASKLSGLGRGSVVLTRARVLDGWGRTVVLVVGGAPILVEKARPPSRLGGAVLWARRRVGLALGRMSPPELHGLFTALVLGDRSGLAPLTSEAFARTGTAHLLAISGLHVGACMFLFWKLAARLLGYLPSAWTVAGLPARLGAVAGLAAAAGYVVVAGAPVSGRRALVMAAVLAVAFGLGRRVSPWNALAAACVCVLWVDPAAARAVGFQLSVLSVGGLLAWAHWASIPGSRSALLGVLRAAAGLLWTGVIGTLATAPLVACVWGRVPLAGLWVNTVAVPLLGAATIPPLLVGSALGAVDPVLGAPFVWVASWPARLGLGLVAALADPVVAPVIPWHPAPIVIWSLYGVVAALVVLGRDR